MSDQHPLEQANQAVDALYENMEMVRKQIEINAVALRTAYESLQRAGFTNEQAFELIKARGGFL
jgi:hypothetical protein